jgi:hypothetical protein
MQENVMTQHTALLSETQSADAMLRARARLVVPGGMWGHLNAARLPEGYPQFFASAEGCRVRDVGASPRRYRRGAASSLARFYGRPRTGSEIQSISRRCRPEPMRDLRASIKMPRNAVFTTSDGGAVIGENGEIAE